MIEDSALASAAEIPAGEEVERGSRARSEKWRPGIDTTRREEREHRSESSEKVC